MRRRGGGHQGDSPQESNIDRALKTKWNPETLTKRHFAAVRGHKTRCWALSVCIYKCICGRVTAPNPAGGAYSAPQTPEVVGRGLVGREPSPIPKNPSPALVLRPRISALRTSVTPKKNSWLRPRQKQQQQRLNACYGASSITCCNT